MKLGISHQEIILNINIMNVLNNYNNFYKTPTMQKLFTLIKKRKDGIINYLLLSTLLLFTVVYLFLKFNVF